MKKLQEEELTDIGRHLRSAITLCLEQDKYITTQISVFLNLIIGRGILLTSYSAVTSRPAMPPKNN